MKVTLIQPDLAWQQPEANRSRLARMMDGAGESDLFVLPETFPSGFLGDQGSPSEGMDGPTVAWLREQAAERNAAVTGSAAIEDAGRRYNRMLFATPRGELHQYDKRHLFGFGGEDRRYTMGESRTVFEWRGWRINLQVCYDLRFPVWCRNRDDYDLMLFVANWPAPRVEAWRCLLRARAIENQAFVVGVNRRGGDGNDLQYLGASSVWDGMGACLVEMDDKEGAATVELDLEALKELRRRFPFQKDRDDFQMPPS